MLGASRTITSGNDSFRHKEWDKATGVFVGSSECYRNVTLKDGWYIEDLTVTIEASATNMWNPNPPVLGLNPTTFILISASLVLVVLILSLIVVLARKKTITFTHLSQGKIAALVAVVMLVVMVGSVFVVPFFDISLGVHEVNLIMQTFWTSLVLVSMWFRRKGNFFAHAIVMLVVVSAMLVSFHSTVYGSP